MLLLGCCWVWGYVVWLELGYIWGCGSVNVRVMGCGWGRVRVWLGLLEGFVVIVAVTVLIRYV